MITFNEEEHKYYIDGKPVRWSVTELLEHEGFIQYYNSSEWHMKFGSYVHKACELYDKDDLNESSLDDKIKPYFEAWKKFLHDFSPVFEMIEEPLVNKAGNIGGTPDRIAIINGGLYLIEIKKGSYRSGYALQTAGYQWLYELTTAKIESRYIVLLSEGKYKLKECSNKRDISTFVGILNGANWKLKHNLIK